MLGGSQLPILSDFDALRVKQEDLRQIIDSIQRVRRISARFRKLLAQFAPKIAPKNL
jgi:hypothetical protein